MSAPRWEAVAVTFGHWEIYPVDRMSNTVPVAVLDHSRDAHMPTRAAVEYHAILMAAAPKLMKALENLVAAEDQFVSDTRLPLNDPVSDAVAAARTALREAKGVAR